MIIATQNDFAEWKGTLRHRVLDMIKAEYSKIDAILGYNVDETAKTAPMDSLYPFDERVEADLKDLIDDAFWQISRDLAREEAA